MRYLFLSLLSSFLFFGAGYMVAAGVIYQVADFMLVAMIAVVIALIMTIKVGLEHYRHYRMR